MKFRLTALLLVCVIAVKAQLLIWTPDFAGDGSSIEITVDANFGNKGLLGYNPNDVYVHTGVITNLSTSPSNWRYVKENANFNTPNANLKAESLGGNRWRFRILAPQTIRSYYGVPGGETILKISILFRNGAGTSVQRNADGSDMYIPVYAAGLQTRITNPFKQPTYVPVSEPITVSVGQQLPITAKASQSSNMKLFLNGSEIASQGGATTISASPVMAAAGNQRIIAESESGGIFARDTIDFFLPDNTVVQALPDGVSPNGATYHNGGTSATLVLYAPNKTSIVILGDFNDWMPSIAYQMKRTPDGLRYWITLEGLTPGTEYAYQYLIDGILKVADYNSEKILDPWNDPAIPSSTYPNLKPYPTGKTTDIVSVLQPGKPVYNWVNNSFQRPDKRNIVAYELLIRDFSSEKTFQSVIDKLGELASLGINTLGLMPFTEFENNNSWGYNPSFMFAVDKYYGPENKLRELIDSCHGRGIAVTLDMVLNHQFGQSPMVRMYWDAAAGKPATNNPWFNPDARHPFNVGYDMNHEAPATIEFTENVMRHWLTKFRIDGFRWDLSKGFTQTNNPNNVGAWSDYDQSRINIWDRIYNQSQAISPGCYMILEHLGNDQEEAELAKRGMILWGKMSSEFSEAAMGWVQTGTGHNFGRTYHTTRWSDYGGNNVPLLMGYAESHDEERMLYRNRRFANQNGAGFPSFHDPRFVSTTFSPANPSTALLRMQQMAAFLFTIPGPKMVWQFGEWGYDASINMCENYTTPNSDACRLSPKPLPTAMPNPYWSTTVPSPPGFTFLNYTAHGDRIALRNMYSRILRLRTADNNAYLNTFTTNNVSFDLGGRVKWQIIQSNDLRIVVLGNFDVESQNGSVNFPVTGTWIVYATNISGSLTGMNSNFSGSGNGATFTIGSTNQTFTNIPPGGFLLLIDRPAILPVTLLSFTAQRMPGHINLVWNTTKEKDLAGFEIERSLDGVHYKMVGKVGANNTGENVTHTYQFADTDPVAVQASGKVFYRIRMVDKKSEFSYSPVQAVDPLRTTAKPMVIPNPVENNSVLAINLPAEGTYHIKMVNIYGQVMGTLWNGYREKGMQNIPLSQGGVKVSNLSAGTYFVKIEGKGVNEVLPFIKR